MLGGSLALPRRWLSEEERSESSRFRSPERWRSWIAGRVAAKRMLFEEGLVPEVKPADVTIVSRDSRGKGIAPLVRVVGEVVRLSLSISHTERGVLVAVSRGEGIRVGVDLVIPTELGDGFHRLWFTEREQELMRQSGGRLSATRLWAAKEAAYKAMADGRPFSPRLLEIQQDEHGFVCTGNGRNTGKECRIQDWIVDGQIAALAVCRKMAVNRRRRTYEMCG